MWFRRGNKAGVESEEALKDATKNLCEVQKRQPEVTKIANALKEFRERNHFAEQLEEIVLRQKGHLR